MVGYDDLGPPQAYRRQQPPEVLVAGQQEHVGPEGYELEQHLQVPDELIEIISKAAARSDRSIVHCESAELQGLALVAVPAYYAASRTNVAGHLQEMLHVICAEIGLLLVLRPLAIYLAHVCRSADEGDLQPPLSYCRPLHRLTSTPQASRRAIRRCLRSPSARGRRSESSRAPRACGCSRTRLSECAIPSRNSWECGSRPGGGRRA